MKETARNHLREVFIDWCDAIEYDDAQLIKVCYNQFIGALDMYEELFNELVYYRAKTRELEYEER